MKIEAVGIVFNPISGSGKGGVIARDLSLALRERGFLVSVSEVLPLFESGGVSEFLGGVDLLLLVGGDGSLMYFLDDLVSSQTPVYLVPAGNESLFAREFSMSRAVAEVVSAIEHGEVSKHFVGEANGRKFFTMVSAGLDSQVVQLISASRSGTINHFSYIAPTVKSLFGHKPFRFSLTVDGKEVLSGVEGFLVISNNKQYACRLKLAPEALSSKRELVVRFFPYARIYSFILWLLKVRFANKLMIQQAPVFFGNSVTFQATGTENYPVQADGEYLGESPVRVSILDSTINVLHHN